MWTVKEFFGPEDLKNENTQSTQTPESGSFAPKHKSSSVEQNTSKKKVSPTCDSHPIHSWAEDDRPREKMASLGAEALSNAELLAILIGSGNTKESAVDLMKRILSDNENNLNQLGRMSISELMQYNGIGEAKAISILAACELGKRREHEEKLKRADLGTPDALFEHLLPRVRDLDVEESFVVMMNQNFRHLKTIRLSHGGITETAVDVRLIIKEAVLCNATIIALAHNHPSGNCQPSGNDDRLTKQVKNACETMRFHFLDHLIVTEDGYYSYREHGKI